MLLSSAFTRLTSPQLHQHQQLRPRRAAGHTQSSSLFKPPFYIGSSSLLSRFFQGVVRRYCARSFSSSSSPRIFLFRTQRFLIAQISALQDNFVYLVKDTEPNHAGEFDTFCIDPSEAEPVLRALELLKWPRLQFILNTHHHNDHTGGNLKIKEATGCSVMGSADGASRIPGIDFQMVNMEVWPSVSRMATFSVLSTPGHTKDHISFLFHSSYPKAAKNNPWLEMGQEIDWVFKPNFAGNSTPSLSSSSSSSSANLQVPAVSVAPLKADCASSDDCFQDPAVPIVHGDVLFCGDTLFSMGCGKLLEGTAEQLFNSLRKYVYLHPSTLICCGHEYSEANARFASSLDNENPALRARIAQLRRQLKLGMPTVPSSLQAELLTNPFLLVDSNLAGVCQNAVATSTVQRDRERILKALKLPPDVSDVEAFAALRRAKDEFK